MLAGVGGGGLGAGLLSICNPFVMLLSSPIPTVVMMMMMMMGLAIGASTPLPVQANV